MKLPFTLEPLLQNLRIGKAMPHIVPGGVIVDVGCDTTPKLLQAVRHKMKKCIGLDAEVRNGMNGSIELRRCVLKKKIPMKASSADVVTMLAVLEHLDHPEEIVRECYRILKPKGVLLVTVPSPRNEPLLNLLSWVGLVRKEMIDQHKNYFTKLRLKMIFEDAGFKNVLVESFELGFNTFAKAVK